MPASYQYVKRPKWQTDADVNSRQKKEVTSTRVSQEASVISSVADDSAG